MIITRTPYRISLVGGGTDFPEYFNEHGGSVIGFALAQYCHLMVRELPPYFEYKHRVVWSQIERVDHFENIEHPAVKVIMREYLFNEQYGYAVHHDGDLPARSGMGSSSSFVVGLLHSVLAMAGHERPNKGVLAEDAIRIERELMAEPGGWQDQIFAAHGGFNRIDFADNDYKITPIYMSPKRLKYFLDHLMMVFTGFARDAWQLEAAKIQNMEVNKSVLDVIKETVPVFEKALCDSTAVDIPMIAQVLDDYWRMKKLLAPGISTSHLNDMYSDAMRAGAWGGKLLGAGGGGYFLFVVPPDARSSVKQALGNPIEVPIKIDYYGSNLMMFDPQGAR